MAFWDAHRPIDRTSKDLELHLLLLGLTIPNTLTSVVATYATDTTYSISRVRVIALLLPKYPC